MKKLFQYLMMISLGLFFTSCYYDTVYEDITDGGNVPDVVSYQNDISPLWGQCVGCHSGDIAPDLRADVSYKKLLDGYVVPKDAEGSILYKSLLGIDGVSLMPPGSQWPNSKINLVKAWIDQGALDN
ncbi:hypothetical protein [Gelidibacter salicanalis]|uniref:Cytochrome c domain-containing protein n=1 Tax=Gelidibacter salicanalis TaxID=291193 RepID=A0A934NKE7_9FLAO|nr:hypothetical protein [Gelidibacter salicanalis]MBJ7880202.1 hypothetical protein [Gelidibacter salicanalis]